MIYGPKMVLILQLYVFIVDHASGATRLGSFAIKLLSNVHMMAGGPSVPLPWRKMFELETRVLSNCESAPEPKYA